MAKRQQRLRGEGGYVNRSYMDLKEDKFKDSRKGRRGKMFHIWKFLERNDNKGIEFVN